MRIEQALQKLRNSVLWGYNPTTLVFDDLKNDALLEVSGHWISERVSFNARRVLLVIDAIPTTTTIIKIGDSVVRHLIYSKQENFSRGKVVYQDYTILDETDSSQTVTIATTPAASGMGTTKVETLSTEFPAHMVRFGSTRSEELDQQEFTRLYAFVPGDTVVDDDMELEISGTRYVITESVKELLCIRVALMER